MGVGDFVPSRGRSSCREPFMGKSMEHSRTCPGPYFPSCPYFPSPVRLKRRERGRVADESCRALTIMERLVLLSLGQGGDLRASLRGSKRLGLVPRLSAVRGRVGLRTQAHLTAQSALFAMTP